MTLVSFSCHLSPLFIFLSPFYAFSPVHKTSPLLSSHQLSLPSHLSCQISQPFPLLSDISSHASHHHPTLPTVSHPAFTFTPTGSQGAPRLPPSDRLCRHHGSSVLSKRRLGPRESLTFYPFSFFLAVFCSAFLTALIDFILTFIIISNGEENHYSQVKINPCIDPLWREKRKTCQTAEGQI